MMMAITECQWVGAVVAVLCLIGAGVYLARVAPSANAELDEAIFPFNRDAKGDDR